MALCGSYVSTLECVIDYNNTLEYKLIILGLLLLYSFFALYLNRSYKYEGDMFQFFRVLLYRTSAYMYLTFLPFLLILIRPTVTFETFLLLIAVFYIIVFVLGLSLGLLFSWNKIKGLYSKQNRDALRQNYKYRNGN